MEERKMQVPISIYEGLSALRPIHLAEEDKISKNK